MPGHTRSPTKEARGRHGRAVRDAGRGNIEPVGHPAAGTDGPCDADYLTPLMIWMKKQPMMARAMDTGKARP